MTARAEARVVYAAGAVQGIVLVTMPAASTIFTDPRQYGLTSSQYGAMFMPQVATAVAGALLGARLSRRVGTKAVYQTGLGFGLAAMLALILSQFVMAERASAFGLLLLATALLGAGFGLTVPALNSLTAGLHPGSVESSVLILNALLGVGTALAPVFVALFVGLGFWWGLPLMSAILLGILIARSARLTPRIRPTGRGTALPTESKAPLRAPTPSTGGRVTGRFWFYLAFIVGYGACETLNGNWAQIDMTADLGASVTHASLALTAFWGMVTVGRVLFAVADRRVAAQWTFHLLPFALAVAFLLIAALPPGRAWLGILAFGLAGLSCSALLPHTISFGQEEFPAAAAFVSGAVIAGYQVGYGIAAFGVGPLRDAGVALSSVYRWAAVLAAVMGVLSFAVARRPHSNA